MAQKQMTERQRRFAEAYWALKDARQAAEQALLLPEPMCPVNIRLRLKEWAISR